MRYGYTPFCMTEIVFADKKKLWDTLESLDGNLVIIVSKSSVMRWEFENQIHHMDEKTRARGKSFIWIDSVAANPTPEDVAAVLHRIGGRTVDTIIAIGGGSAIDLAKAIGAFKEMAGCINQEIIIDGIRTKSYMHSSFPDIIAVPSTAGTGSEVTQWATLWDKKNKVKYSLDTPELQPKLAIIVPELTTSLPSTMTLSTGLDALCQAVEAYWSKHTSPLVQEIALRAVELIMENLRNGVDEPKNLQARQRLCMASTLAGMAFAKTKTTACHSISYPLTLFFDVPHGFAVSLTLGAVLERNLGHFPNDKRLLSSFDQHGGLNTWLESVCREVIELRLPVFGISAEDLPVIVHNAFAEGRMDNNPVALTEDDVMDILMSVM
ncbi:MAG: phosphonoacetaldehyde reductase [Firmicutes bacterium]|jgi:alcohol dehydrogenase class IV|nr:phosphonoacetaldehyde reductase [Bacillota bacterium]